MQDQTQWPTLESFLSLSNEELGKVDPVVMNLVVAKGILALANLDICRYVKIADDWANNSKARLPALENNFRKKRYNWKNDIDFFRLGHVCWFVDIVLGIAYREDQRNVESILYTDPSDLFLNGVMDARRGTCGNLSLLHVVLGRRIGLPVSLACAGSHFVCRFDNGIKTFNIETTNTGHGGFVSDPDDYILKKCNLPPKAKECGSDLHAVTPREMLGLFLGLRARHLENTWQLTESEQDYLLARYLFPRNRQLYKGYSRIGVLCSMDLFEPHEKGHPMELANWLQEVVRVAPWTRKFPQSPQKQKEKCNGNNVNALCQQIIIGRNF